MTVPFANIISLSVEPLEKLAIKSSQAFCSAIKLKSRPPRVLSKRSHSNYDCLPSVSRITTNQRSSDLCRSVQLCQREHIAKALLPNQYRITRRFRLPSKRSVRDHLYR